MFHIRKPMSRKKSPHPIDTMTNETKAVPLRREKIFCGGRVYYFIKRGHAPITSPCYGTSIKVVSPWVRIAASLNHQ